MSEEFASIDLSQERPPSALGTPIDEAFFRTSLTPEYRRNNPRVSPLDIALEAEREAEATRRIRAEYAETQAKELLIQQREQAQRAEVFNRVSSIESLQAQSIPTPIDPPATQADLQQFQTRQPRPSTVRPPPINVAQPQPAPARLPLTPNTSGAVIDFAPTARPLEAILRSPTPPINPATGAKPNTLPEPAGISPKGLYAGVLVSTAFRIASGQPVDQALFGASAETIGSVVGGVGGSLLGPVGSFLGGIAGGMIAGNIADQIYAFAHPKKAALFDKSNKVGILPFTGGQSFGVAYNVYIFINDSYDPGQRPIEATGKILGIVYPPPANTFVALQTINSTGIKQDIVFGQGFKSNIHHITRADGQPDVGGDPAPSPIQKDTRVPISTQHPGNTDFAVPSATPEARKQNVSVDNYVPGSTANKSNGNKRGDSPDWVPHGGLKGTPHPVHMPQPLLSPLPIVEAARSPLPFADPEDFALPGSNSQPVNGTFTVPNPLPLSDPEGGSIVLPFAPSVETTEGVPVTPVPIHKVGSPFDVSQLDPKNATPAPIPKVGQATNTPDSNKPAPVTTPIGTGLAPAPQPEFQPVPNLSQKELEDKINQLGLGLVGLTALMQGLQTPVNNIAQNTTPENLRKAAKDGTCDTVQEPDGCLLPLANNAQAAANNSIDNGNKLDGINATLNTAELGLLKIMDNKLGVQMPGGLSAGFGRLSNFLGIDRVLNLINTMAILHNAMMLSNGLKITLLETLSSIGNATGLLQTAENDNVDLNTTFDKGITLLIDSVIGEERRVELELLFKKYNRIYQAGANVVNSVQSMMSSIANVVEVTAEYTGKIGNSLKAVGAVAENAYQWMAEQQNARISKFLAYTSTVAGATIILSALNEVAESVIEGQQAKTEADAATVKFKQELASAEKNPGVENKTVADEIKRQKDAANANTEGDDDTGLFSSITD